MAKSISCGHCGGTHGSVAEVRACSLTSPPSHSAGAPPPPEPTRRRRDPGPGPVAAAGTGAPAEVVALPGPPERWAGPEALGRGLVVPAGDPVPAPWTDRPRIAASVDADADTVARLHHAWRLRERVVVDWSGPWPPAESGPFDVPFSALAPDTELPGERLRFVVTANTVVAVTDQVTFAPTTDAVRLGSTVPDSSGTPPVGDVALPDGTVVWADGGPLSVPAADELDPTVPVVPRVHLTAGRLRAVAPSPTRPNAELAPDQLAAVAHPGGPARIIAPAGSGKTRVITERTRHLVAGRGLHPAAVSLVAYNRRARAEMAARLDDVAGLDIRTLNSLALAIATGRRPFTGSTVRDRATIDELDARRLLERLVPGRRRRALTDPLEPWIDALSACRLGLRDPAEVEEAYGADVTGFVELIARYREELARRGQLDYDEQILAAIEVLCTDPAARAAARAAAPVLLVDEFQDLTPAHLLLIRLIAGPAAEVFAVGDDDQTIYGYTGASPTWLIEFDRFFPGSVNHPLTVNYRCPPAVVTAATNLLSHNRRRVPKKVDPAPGRPDTDAMWITGGTLPGPGPGPVRSASAPTPEPGPSGPDGPGLPLDPAGRTGERVLVDHVRELLNGGAGPGDVAVLARVNAALLAPLLHLADAGIPVGRPPGVDSRMLERSGTGAALAWLRLAAAPEQRLSGDDLRAVLRRPPRSLHPRIADWVCEQTSVADLRRLAGRLNNERDAGTVAGLANDIADLRSRHERQVPAGDLLDVVYHEIGLMGAASQLDRSQRVARRAAHADELTALRAVADLAPRDTDLGAWLHDQLDALPAVGAAAPSGDGDGPLVTLATIHATKGLEWPHVVVHRVSAELHPHVLAEDVEEERRVMHVAITRGRETVLVNATATRGPTASPFVAELLHARPADRPWLEAAAPVAANGSGRTSGSGSGSGRTRGGPAERPEPSGPEEAARREALTEWRRERSRTDGVPAYIVFDNATLDAIAAGAPATLGDLGKVKGIGPAKLERYGADVLAILADQAAG
ncbi:MAG: UvrD-helicase domain-containing protein [Acidimicrobiales bacterium]